LIITFDYIIELLSQLCFESIVFAFPNASEPPLQFGCVSGALLGLNDCVVKFQLPLGVSRELQVLDAVRVLREVVQVGPQAVVRVLERVVLREQVVRAHDCAEALRLVRHEDLLHRPDVLQVRVEDSPGCVPVELARAEPELLAVLLVLLDPRPELGHFPRLVLNLVFGSLLVHLLGLNDLHLDQEVARQVREGRFEDDLDVALVSGFLLRVVEVVLEAVHPEVGVLSGQVREDPLRVGRGPALD